jgi:hypothetical protein
MRLRRQAHHRSTPIGAVIPRDVDVELVGRFLIDCAKSYGTGGPSTPARFSLVPSTSPSRPQICDRRSTLPAQPAAPFRRKPSETPVWTTRKHRQMPRFAALLSGLTRDPEARGWYPGTARRRGSLKGPQLAAGAGNPKRCRKVADSLVRNRRPPRRDSRSPLVRLQPDARHSHDLQHAHGPRRMRHGS